MEVKDGGYCVCLRTGKSRLGVHTTMLAKELPCTNDVQDNLCSVF